MFELKMVFTNHEYVSPEEHREREFACLIT